MSWIIDIKPIPCTMSTVLQVGIAPTHSTSYQIHTDISLFKHICQWCDHFHVSKEIVRRCERCGENQCLENGLDEEHTELMMELIKKYCHYDGEEEKDYDEWEESEVHADFEDMIRSYDWWFGTYEQNQYVWSLLKKMDENVHCALRYFERDYIRAFHEDVYCY